MCGLVKLASKNSQRRHERVMSRVEIKTRLADGGLYVCYITRYKKDNRAHCFFKHYGLPSLHFNQVYDLIYIEMRYCITFH